MNCFPPIRAVVPTWLEPPHVIQGSGGARNPEDFWPLLSLVSLAAVPASLEPSRRRVPSMTLTCSYGTRGRYAQYHTCAPARQPGWAGSVRVRNSSANSLWILCSLSACNVADVHHRGIALRCWSLLALASAADVVVPTYRRRAAPSSPPPTASFYASSVSGACFFCPRIDRLFFTY
ncbi:hypothetical protein Taro_053495 [Colocasia esculenta]|uniref:Uncharacterized protein n=1 Tax=Colocasia esculenta TaxID=4460 RepID=A0A843XMR4_COLES|nr:hypothetical protein [Colocasia esculenta]